jgi:hypothetical protein
MKKAKRSGVAWYTVRWLFGYLCTLLIYRYRNKHRLVGAHVPTSIPHLRRRQQEPLGVMEGTRQRGDLFKVAICGRLSPRNEA